MTAIAPPTARPTTERRVVLDGVSWSLYEQILRAVGDSNAVRLTYDGGRLEIMSPSNLHESVKKIAARLLETFSVECGIPIEGFGSWTLKRADLEKGLEPDECYYVQSLPLIADKRELDLNVDPPPDLAIEVDISPHDVARQPIYGALGVPEIWRYDGRRMSALLRSPDGSYAEAEQSLALPTLAMADFNRFIEIGLTSRQHAAVEALRQWVKGRRKSP